MKSLALVPAAVAAFVALGQAAAAAPAIGLVGDRTLVMFDTETATAARTVEVKGVDGLMGIDWRPADGKVYGVTYDGQIVTIDPASGRSAPKAKLDMVPAVGANTAVIDFNPAADKLRVVIGTTNLRIDPESGKVTTDKPLAFVKEDMHAGEKPAVAAGAYTNSFGKPEKAKLFHIDATIGALIQQTVPNDGTLAAIGKLGIAASDAYAMDVQTTADGKNTAWLVAGGALHQVSLEAGAVTQSWPLQGVKGTIRDLTVLPAK